MASPNSNIAVQAATNPSKKLATYEFVDGGGDVVESEAVTLTDGTGLELVGQMASIGSVPVVIASDQSPVPITSPAATFHNGAETAVSNVPVLVLPANPTRAWAILQNTGSANVRIGVAGVGPTTGLRLVPNGVVTIDQLNMYQGDLFAIREGPTDSIVFAQEATVP